MSSAIRERIKEFLSYQSKPVSALQIRQRGSYPQTVAVIETALRAMARDGEVIDEGKYRYSLRRSKAASETRLVKRNGSVKKKTTANKAPAKAAQKPPPAPAQVELVPGTRFTHKRPEEIPALHRQAVEKIVRTPAGIDQALEDLEQRLAPCEVEDLDIKIQVLNRLAALVDPSIARVLGAIADDLNR